MDIVSIQTENPSRFALGRQMRWQRKNRQHVRDGLRATQDDRVARNRSRRILENSGRKKECVNCGSRQNLEVNHKDGDAQNDNLSNLEWKCKKCHGSHEGRYPKTWKPVK